MVKYELPAVDARLVFNNLTDRDDHPFFSWRSGKQGWKRLLAYRPVDNLSFYPGDNHGKITTFCSENSRRFIAGYFSYDLGLTGPLGGYELLPANPPLITQTEPLVMLFAYDQFLEFKSDRTILHTNEQGHYEDRVTDIMFEPETAYDEYSPLQFRSELSREDYFQKIHRIQDYIRAGHIYQVNLTHQLQADAILPEKAQFLRLLKKNPVGYAAYLENENNCLMSLSPELFIHTEGSSIFTSPIKGTRPRGKTKQEDKNLLNELLESSKEQAELFMIIDLLRNDLGRVCEIGTVSVDRKKAVQKLRNVFHTYADISGKLRSDISGIDALISMFPGGSISGCPKKRAMEIISELESAPRGIYTGSIGYILPGGDCTFNIAIRTLVQTGSILTLGIGGGITIASDPEDEFNETFAKAQSFMN